MLGAGAGACEQRPGRGGGENATEPIMPRLSSSSGFRFGSRRAVGAAAICRDVRCHGAARQTQRTENRGGVGSGTGATAR